MSAGFCVIYRWKLVPGKEDQFTAAWEAADVDTEDARKAAERMVDAVNEKMDPILLDPVADLVQR